MFTTTKDAELKLVDLVESIENEATQWRAVYFHFAQLQEHYQSQYQIKIAMNLVVDLLSAQQGGLFVFEDYTLIVVCKGILKTQIDKVIFQLRYLFADDPLSYGIEGEENPAFCDVYDLSVHYEEFHQVCQAALTRKIRLQQQSAKGEKKDAGAEHAGASANTGFTPHMLAIIERDLQRADLSRVLRQQPICAAVPNMSIRRVYDEFYINIQHLRQVLNTEANLLGNRYLFKYLTQLLDLKMLDMLSRHSGRYLSQPVSLNLNVDTILSEQFAAFDKAIKPSMKVSIVIEIQLEDVFGDMAAFMVARETVQQMGYRVCLDGLTNHTIVQIDRNKLGFDLAKLLWNADLTSDLDSPEGKELKDAVKRCGANRLILCRCDSREAVNYGQAMGISLFQGRFLDQMIDPTSKVEN